MLTWLASRARFGLLVALMGVGVLLAPSRPSVAFEEIAFDAPLTLTPRSQVSFVWRDLNQDGRIDLIGSWEQGVQVYLRRADGSFAGPDVYTLETEAGWERPDNLRIVEDFNGDGFPDIYSVFVNYHRLLQNDGTGRFLLSDTVLRSVPELRISPRAVDMNNDGLRDVMASPDEDEPSNELFWLKSIGACRFDQIGTGTIKKPYEGTVTPQLGLMIYPGLFNADKDFDLSVTSITGLPLNPQWSTSVYSGQGNSSLTPSGTIGFQPRQSCAVGDLNNDGIPDIVGDMLIEDQNLNNYRAFLQIRYSDGLGFNGFDFPCDDIIVSNICIADLNMDGWNDLVFRSRVGVNMPGNETDFINIFLNAKMGDFTRHIIEVKPLSINAIQIVDFDQDTVPDILAHKKDGFLFYRNLTPPRPTTQTAVSYWAGNKSGADVVSHIDGEELGSVTYAEGIGDDAFDFPETGGSVRIPNDARLLGSPSVTVAAWVNARSYPSPDAPAVIYMRGSDNPRVSPFSLRVESDRRVWLRTECLTDREGISALLLLNRWTHVTGIFDAKRMVLQLYFDGVLVREKGVTFYPTRALDSADRPANCIGNHPGYPLSNTNWSFHGYLDNVQFFDRALTATEVRTLGNVPTSDPPDAPSNLKVATVSDTALQLNWEDRSFNEVRFEVERRVGGGAFVERADLAANTVSYLDTGLQPATTYTYRVRALNGSGASDYCPEASGKTLVSEWLAPSNLEASSFNARKAALFWDDNTPDESAFALERSLDGVHFAALKTLPAGTVETSDVTVLPNSVYRYRIRAVREGQVSAWSNIATVATPPDPPLAPISLIATPKPDQKVLLSWQDRSSSESRFRVDMSEINDSYKEVAQVAANTTSWTSGPLKSNTAYLFRVRAQNAGGFSEYTNVATALTLPLPVTDLTITVPAAPAGETRLDLRWVDPNARPAKAKVVREKGGAVELEVAINAGTVRYSDTSLKPATTYKYSVIALNTSGVSTATSKTAATLTPPPPPDPPLAPDQAACTLIDAKSASLKWRDRSTDETGFEVERATAGAAFVKVKTLAANATAWLDSTLKPSTSYRYRLRAVRNAVFSDYSAEVGVTTPPLPPAAPASLTAAADGIERVNLKWADKSVDETGFRIERAVGSNGAFGEIGTAAAGATTFADSTVSPATTYRYRVLAENSGGRSGYSNLASVTTARVVRGSLQVTGALAFRAVKVRKTKTLVLTFKNISATEKLSLDVEPMAAPFQVVSGGGEGVLSPGASRTVQVSFTPKKAKKFKSTLTATTSDPQHQAVGLPATGKGK